MMKSKKKKDTPKREHDRWVAKRSAARRDYDKFVKVRAKLHEADVERKRQIKTVADFLKQVLPPTTTTTSSAQRDASHSQTEHGPPVKPNIRRLLHLRLGVSFMRRPLLIPRPLLKGTSMMNMT